MVTRLKILLLAAIVGANASCLAQGRLLTGPDIEARKLLPDTAADYGVRVYLERDVFATDIKLKFPRIVENFEYIGHSLSITNREEVRRIIFYRGFGCVNSDGVAMFQVSISNDMFDNMISVQLDYSAPENGVSEYRKLQLDIGTFVNYLLKNRLVDGVPVDYWINGVGESRNLEISTGFSLDLECL